jgi:hypothetical protein
MVLEQVLTIIFAVAVGAAIIVYAARPRHRGTSISIGASAVGSFAPAEVVQAAPMPQVTAFETPAVETFSPETHVVEVAPVEAAPAAVEVAQVVPAMVSAPAAASISETVESPVQSAATARKAQRKRSTATKPRARTSRTKKS